MSESEASAATGDTGGGTALMFSLAIFYLLMAVLIIILSWVLPSITMSSSIAFTLVGSFLFIAAVVNIVYASDIVALKCGSCPPPTPS